MPTNVKARTSENFREAQQRRAHPQDLIGEPIRPVLNFVFHASSLTILPIMPIVILGLLFQITPFCQTFSTVVEQPGGYPKCLICPFLLIFRRSSLVFRMSHVEFRMSCRIHGLSLSIWDFGHLDLFRASHFGFRICVRLHFPFAICRLPSSVFCLLNFVNYILYHKTTRL
jgi:hypothetical protein